VLTGSRWLDCDSSLPKGHPSNGQGRSSQARTVAPGSPEQSIGQDQPVSRAMDTKHWAVSLFALGSGPGLEAFIVLATVCPIR